MRISVLGLGKMGAPMARNLIEVGHEVTLYSRNRDRAVELAGKGGRAALTLAEAVKDTQVALTMVSDEEAERSLTYGEQGLLAHLPPGSIHLCMGTIGVASSRELALAHAEAGQGYVAAPVFGRPGLAASRQLWIAAGGPDVQVDRCLSIFDALGRGITRVGPRAELAHALKLGGNLLTVTLLEGLAEVLAYGEKAGMAPGEYLRLLNTAIFKSPLLDAAGGLMVRHMYDPADLALGAALKDVRSAVQAAEELDAVMPMAELLNQRLELALVQGWGAQDLTALSRSCRAAAGLEEDGGKGEAEDPQGGPRNTTFTALSPEGEVELDIHKVTHFEIIKDTVWAWAQGNRVRTPWRHLAEIERTFSHIPFLRLHRHILLNPDAALARRSNPEAMRKGFGEEHEIPHPQDLSFHLPFRNEMRLEHPVPERALPAEEKTASGAVWLQSRWRNLVDHVAGYLPARPPIPALPQVPEEVPVMEPTRPRIPAPEPLVMEPPTRPSLPLPSVIRTPVAAAREVPAEVPEKPSILEQREHRSSHEGAKTPDFRQASHFELEKGVVWAWVQGARIPTEWRSLAEIQLDFNQVILLKTKRNILLNPEAVLAIDPGFGGRAKVKVAGNMELDVGRAATQRLKELLGI